MQKKRVCNLDKKIWWLTLTTVSARGKLLMQMQVSFIQFIKIKLAKGKLLLKIKLVKQKISKNREILKMKSLFIKKEIESLRKSISEANTKPKFDIFDYKHSEDISF